MKYITFIIQAKYIFLMFLIGILLFLLLIYFISIPGNKKLQTLIIDEKEKGEKKRNRIIIAKVFLIIFICSITILLIINISL